MYQIFPLSLCLLFSSICFTYASDPTFEIVTGNCTDLLADEMLLKRRTRPAPPPARGHLEQLVKWSGDETIYCITVLGLDKKDRHSTAEITKGGLDFRFVDIMLKSEAGFGFQYDVTVYGKIVEV